MLDIKKIIIQSFDPKIRSKIMLKDIERILDKYNVNKNIYCFNKTKKEIKKRWGVDIQDVLLRRR